MGHKVQESPKWVIDPKMDQTGRLTRSGPFSGPMTRVSDKGENPCLAAAETWHPAVDHLPGWDTPHFLPLSPIYPFSATKSLNFIPINTTQSKWEN